LSHLTAELDELAERLGIAREFWDWKGNHTLISEATVIAVLRAMGVEADTPEERRDALARLDEQHWRRVLRGLLMFLRDNRRHGIASASFERTDR